MNLRDSVLFLLCVKHRRDLAGAPKLIRCHAVRLTLPTTAPCRRARAHAPRSECHSLINIMIITLRPSIVSLRLLQKNTRHTQQILRLSHINPTSVFEAFARLSNLCTYSSAGPAVLVFASGCCFRLTLPPIQRRVLRLRTDNPLALLLVLVAASATWRHV